MSYAEIRSDLPRPATAPVDFRPDEDEPDELPGDEEVGAMLVAKLDARREKYRERFRAEARRRDGG